MTALPNPEVARMADDLLRLHLAATLSEPIPPTFRPVPAVPARRVETPAGIDPDRAYHLRAGAALPATEPERLFAADLAAARAEVDAAYCRAHAARVALWRFAVADALVAAWKDAAGKAGGP